MKLEQAARQALEALEELFHSNSTKVAVEKYNIAHNALREALAEQAEQEPVAWYSVKGGFNTCGEGKPLYAAPARTKDLTDYFINELHKDAQDPISFARAVIAADREKNRG